VNDRMILAPRVAERLGVKTSTLAKWRTLGKGPAGAVYLSETSVAYPESEVERFLEARRANPSKRGRPPGRKAA